MSQNIQLKSIKSEALIDRLEKLVQLEKKTSAEIIDYIKEINRRRLYIDLGFTSLFAFLTVKLGYTPASAQRRIDTAKLMEVIPELKEELRSGALNITQVSMVAQSVRQKKKEEPASIVKTETKKELLKKIKNQDINSSQKIIAQSLDLEVKRFEKQRLQKDESIRLELTLSKEQMQSLKRVKELISHSKPNPNWADLFDYLSKDFIRRKDPLVKKKARKSKMQSTTLDKLLPKTKYTSEAEAATGRTYIAVSTSETEAATDRTQITKSTSETEAASDRTQITKSTSETEAASDRTQITKSTSGTEAAFSQKAMGRKLPRTAITRIPISAATKRAIFKRDQNCQWKTGSSKTNCSSKFQLQIDHKVSVWAGGDNNPDNLQLLCSVHNNKKYKMEAGIN